jgi:high-affinity iron transporter
LPPEYRGLEVPEIQLASIEARNNGRILYLENCALCHGTRADGHGVRRNLSSRPQSFTDRAWRDRSSPRSVYFVIQEGVQGTAMPAWKNLDEDQTWDLVAYLLAIPERGP